MFSQRAVECLACLAARCRNFSLAAWASIFKLTSKEQITNLQNQGAGVYWCINPQDNPLERGVKNTLSWTTLGLDVDVAKNGTHVTREEIMERKLEI